MRSETPTVLLVEDDPSLRLLCRVNLELDDYRVLEAGSLEAAEELLGREHVDIVLLDLHVGDRQGTELLPTLRAQLPKPAICLLSGTSEAEPPMSEGVDAFIRKPFDLDHLSATLSRFRTKPAAH